MGAYERIRASRCVNVYIVDIIYDSNVCDFLMYMRLMEQMHLVHLTSVSHRRAAHPHAGIAHMSIKRVCAAVSQQPRKGKHLCAVLLFRAIADHRYADLLEAPITQSGWRLSYGDSARLRTHPPPNR